MACCNYVKATSVAVESPTAGESYWSVTVPETTDLSTEGCLCIGLATSIPTGLSCGYVQVTNGTEILDVLKSDGDYWRPCSLGCRNVLHLRVLTDPAHLLIKGVTR